MDSSNLSEAEPSEPGETQGGGEQALSFEGTLISDHEEKLQEQQAKITRDIAASEEEYQVEEAAAEEYEEGTAADEYGAAVAAEEYEAETDEEQFSLPKDDQEDGEIIDIIGKEEQEEENMESAYERPLDLEEEEPGEIDYYIGSKPYGDYDNSLDYLKSLENEEFQGEGEGELRTLPQYPGEVPGEIDTTLDYNASFSDMDALIKILEGDKCEDPTADDSNKATLGSTQKETSEEQTLASTRGQTEAEKPSDDKLVVLGPNHPKMQRFQKALKEHLERQIYITDCETREMENDVRKRKKEREELGNQLYNLQYELQRQTDALEKFDKDLEKLIEKRTLTEKQTEEIRKEYVLAKQKLDEEVDNEKRVMKSIKEIDMMEWCVRKAAEEFDGELKIRQLIDEKFEKLRYKTESEKRDQDFYLDKVLIHVQRMEQANEGIQRQILAHLEEQKDLSTFIMEAETEIEALNIEKVHLQRAWNETVTVVRTRDEALNAARETLRSTKELLRNRESEMRALQRAISKEQESHERSTVLLKRRKVEERHLENQLETIMRRNDELRNQLTVLFNIRKEIEDELVKSNRVLNQREKELSVPRRRLELLSNEKARLEDAIVEALQEQSSLGKVAQHISHKVEVARNKARRLEAESAKVENDMSKITIQVENLRGELLQKEMLFDELEKKLVEQEKVLADQVLEIKDAEHSIQRKTSEIVRLNKKVQKLIDEQGGKEATPLEREIEELERRIAEEKDICADLQNQWLKQQDELVSLTSRRDEVLSQNDLIRKEAFIMERKKQRLTQELEKKKLEVKKVEKEMTGIRHQISVVNNKLCTDRKQHDQMDKDNILIQNEFVRLLKDAEMEALELQEEISLLEDEKERLCASLSEAHEQSLNWDKKIKYAKELKDSIKKEQESTGSTLKLAIHHMKVRYQELCRAQEKLMQDLERSIERRDRIIQEADYSLKRAHIHPKKTKLNIQRNYTKLKERNRTLMREVIDSEKQVQEMEDKIATLEKEFECETLALQNIKTLVKASDERINEASVQKHKNLIEIILRQQKYKVLEAVKQERYKPLARSKEQLETELRKTEKKCFKLVELSDILMNEFPELELHIKLIKASILPNIK